MCSLCFGVRSIHSPYLWFVTASKSCPLVAKIMNLLISEVLVVTTILNIILYWSVVVVMKNEMRLIRLTFCRNGKN